MNNQYSQEEDGKDGKTELGVVILVPGPELNSEESMVRPVSELTG